MCQQHICIAVPASVRAGDDLKVPKIDKSNLAKTMENIVLHVLLIRGVRGTLLAYGVQYHNKMAFSQPEA